jgi:hypothetical protein
VSVFVPPITEDLKKKAKEKCVFDVKFTTTHKKLKSTISHIISSGNKAGIKSASSVSVSVAVPNDLYAKK